MRHLLYASLLCMGLVAGCEDPERPAAPDNTARNEQDRTGETKTPMDQSNTARDTEITAAVRRAITDDAAMSVDARNCKIITANGVVTLRGVVSNPSEKEVIDGIARAVPGVVRVDNQLEIKVP